MRWIETFKMTLKRLLIIIFLITSIFLLIRVDFYSQKQAKEEETEQTETLLKEINEFVVLMEVTKSEMPKELLETHEYLMSGGLGEKIYRADSRLKDIIMYHGVKTQSVYINSTLKLKKELWIPVFYHEVAHNYWHTKHPVETFEEFETQLFNSENYAYTVQSQAFILMMKHYPIDQKELKTEIEQKLFDSYNGEAGVYFEMIKGNPEAKEVWYKIIEADIKEQSKQQKLLF